MKQFSYQKYYLLCTFNYVCLPVNYECLSFNYVSLSFDHACLLFNYVSVIQCPFPCHSIITFCHAVMAVRHSIITFCHAIMPVCNLIITYCHLFMPFCTSFNYDSLYLSPQKHRLILKLTSAGKEHKLREVNENGVQAGSRYERGGGEQICKYKRETKKWRELYYERALTLLNEAANILTSPATVTDASDRQPQLSQHSNVQLQYKFQVLLEGKKWPDSSRFKAKVQLLQV